jgi:hypothetical protein
MSWRIFRRIRLGGGVNANINSRGVGLSWGIPGLRFGVSAYGRKWISFGIPGTGIYFIKYINSNNRNTGRRFSSNRPPEPNYYSNRRPYKSRKKDIKWRNIK